jgi:Spy/CpxP family protein refolding chaperone
MRTNITQVLALVSAMLLATPAAMAAPHDGDGDHDGGRRGGSYLSQLNLSGAQRATIEQIEAVKDPQIMSLRKQVRTQEQALDTMSPEQAGYQSTAASLAQAEATLAQARTLQHARVHAQIYNVLTSSQKAQLAQLKASAAAADAAPRKP